MLPTQVPPAEGTRTRRDEEGSRVAAAKGRGGVWRGQVLAVPEVAVGYARKTYHIDRSKGKSRMKVASECDTCVLSTSVCNRKMRCISKLRHIHSQRLLVLNTVLPINVFTCEQNHFIPLKGE